jgi:hypothetical protein
MDMRNRNFYRGDYKQYQENRQKNRVFFGIALALIGIVLMLRTMGVLPYFNFEHSWPVVLMVVGTLIGIKSGFRNNAWWILIVVGIANLTPQFMIMGKPSTHYIWPAVIIVVGLAIALRPRKDVKCTPRHKGMETIITTESNLNIDVTFGGKKEVVTSKDFKGGVISVTFAGCELNLAQADIIEPTAVLDFRVSFGGVEMVVPSHWEIQNEINPSFGSVDDERVIQTATTTENKKILILRGSCSFGSIEIKSY